MPLNIIVDYSEIQNRIYKKCKKQSHEFRFHIGNSNGNRNSKDIHEQLSVDQIPSASAIGVFFLINATCQLLKSLSC